MTRALSVPLLVSLLACGGDSPSGSAEKAGSAPPAKAAPEVAKAPAKLPPPPPTAPASAAPRVEGTASPPPAGATPAKAEEDPAVAKAKELEAARMGKMAGAAPIVAPTGPPRAAPRIDFAKKEVDFGKKLDGDMCEGDFPFENIGDAPLIITKVQPSCGCTVPLILVGDQRYDFGKAIPVGAEGKIHVSMNLKGIHGAKTANVSVFTNDPAGPANLRVQAQVEAFFVVEPQNLSLGEISKKEGKSGTVKVSCARVPSFKITGWDPLPAGLTIQSEEVPGEANPTAKVTATVGEGANEGTFSSRVVLHTDVGRTIDLYVSGMVYGVLEIKPGPYLMFGLIQRGTKTPRKIDAIARTQGLPIHVTKVEVEAQEGGTPQNAKSLTEFFTSTVRPVEDGKHYEIEVAALETLPAGVFRGTVRVFTDHPEVPKKEIILSGFVR